MYEIFSEGHVCTCICTLTIVSARTFCDGLRVYLYIDIGKFALMDRMNIHSVESKAYGIHLALNSVHQGGMIKPQTNGFSVL